MKLLLTLMYLACLSACSNEPSNESAAPQAVETEPEPVVTKEDAAECDKAKEAAVASRQKYDRDYVARNPGFQSMSLSIEELTSCKLAKDGAFVGKWGGSKWRYVPKIGGGYTTNPKNVWVGENEGLDDLSWFSEWRADGASVSKNEELNRKIKTARNIYG